MAAPQRYALTASASLLHNNLAASAGGTLACVHNSINTGEGRLMFHDTRTGQSTSGPEATQVTSIRFIELAYGSVLVVGSATGSQIWSEDGANMLYFMQLTDTSEDPNVLKYHQGACFVPSLHHIICGTSKGGLAAVQSYQAGVFLPFMEMPPASFTNAIEDLCFNAAGNNVVTAHQNGELRLWDPLDGGSRYADRCANGGIPGAQSPTRVAALGSRLLVACSQGKVDIRDAITLEMQAEISAHARCLTAMHVREELSQVLTAGEDTVLNVWQIDPSTGQVAIVSSQVVADKLLTGLCPHPAGGVAVTAYDSDELFHVAA